MILPVLLWAATAALWLPSGAGAADSGWSIRTITPVGETADYRGHARIAVEDTFDVIGLLNRNESDRVIIGDRELLLAPGAKIYRVSLNNLVGAKLNEAGEAVVVDLISDAPH
jgi:hypothetical protein